MDDVLMTGHLCESDSENAALAREAVERAHEMIVRAEAGMRLGERLQAAQLARLMEDPVGKVFTFALADEVFRPPGAARQARRYRDLLEDFGVPIYLSIVRRLAVRAGDLASRVAPELVMPQIAEQLRRESSNVILPAETDKLRPHLESRERLGIRLNFNQLGEAVLGEAEALHRLEANLERLGDPDCDYISVKFSAIFSQIHPVGAKETLDILKERLRRLYRAAMKFRRKDGKAKFVNLDMEEYRDLRLTWAAFRDVLDEFEFRELEAGIVLQAYLPDAWPVQKELNEWARRRVARGGAGIKVRLVKGANLAMERVESELHGWPLAPYGTKRETDANFKRMLHEGCAPENAAAVRLGVASHNLFDVAYAMLLREREGVEDRVEFEMLEGMANHQARVLHEMTGEVLLYAPVVRAEDFHSAIAYLVRRLDENTSPENFLHDLFGMKPGDGAWRRQRKRFLEALKVRERTRFGPNRTQDRAAETIEPLALEEAFRNEPDTDWALPRNVKWIRDRVEALRGSAPEKILLQIGGEWAEGEAWAEGEDPSRPGEVLYRHALGGRREVEWALKEAVQARESWQARGFRGRAEVLAEAGAALGKSRGEAIAAMVADAGKAVMEADTEVSEAIDFANYYARSMIADDWFDGSRFEPLGTVLITPPWNFPYAIPCGGVVAALAAGATVILKPAPETVMTAWVMVKALWRAGVPKEALQFLPCPDNEIGRALVTDDRIDAVVLTGAQETARMFLSWKPELQLLAETSGKNALIVTAAADPDLAIRDLVRSAFGHAGQKCSAASLAIVEAQLYDDPDFRRRLKDAASSLKVGPSWEFDAVITPLIREPGHALRRALTTLDEGESWLLEPENVGKNPRLWSPGIKLGVDPGGWYRRTECFGPVLGLIRAENLNEALRIQNDSEFGLTGGIHSLDPREIEFWQSRVEIGNAYVNRGITGAIVRRQSFGGWKRSCFGLGAKAGGPNYVAQFGSWHEAGEPRLRAAPGAAVLELLESIGVPGLRAAAESDAYWLAREFAVEHDPTGLRCELNVFRYRRFSRVLLRATGPRTLARMLLAAVAAGCAVECSLPPDFEAPAWLSGFRHQTEDDPALTARLGGADYGVVRADSTSEAVKLAAVEAGVRLVARAPVANGRIELLPYFREQALSETRHRHGSVLPRPQDLP